MKDGMVQSEVVTAVIQPRILFKPGSWLAKIDFINHLILFNNVLITVLSEKEGGKTSFCNLLQGNLDQQIKSLGITLKSSCTIENIIKELATLLDLDPDENKDIAAIVAQINERKAHVVILIDNAQYMPEPLINDAMLAIKNQENFGFFHLCLLSDYSIVETLNNLVTLFYDNLVHTIELGALNESETRTYVLQRAMSAHLINRPLTDAQFKQLYQLTKGSLAKINSNLEAFVFKCSNPRIKEPIPRRSAKKAVIAASVAFIAGLVGFYFSQSYDLESFSQLKIVTSLSRIFTATKQPAEPEVLISQIASWQDSSTRQLVHSGLPKKQIFDDVDDEMPTDTVGIIDKVVVIPKIQLKNQVKAELDVSEHELVMESKLVKISEVLQDSSVKFSSLTASSKLYTIQIAASRNKNDILLFQKSNKLLANNAKLRHFTNEKGMWYVLVMGEYQNSGQAQQDIGKLPTTLVKWKPWVRLVSTLG